MVAPVYRATRPILHVLNLPALYPTDEARPMLYIAARTGAGHMATTAAISVYISRDGGTVYEYAMELPAHATMGMVVAVEGNPFTADGALVYPSDSSVVETWERNVSLPIQWYGGYAPQTVTESAALDGANAVVVGEEVLQYMTVAATYGTGLGATDRSGNGIWHHSDLLRGRQGTEGECAAMDAGMVVIVVNPSSLVGLPLLHSDIGRTLHIKAATPGLDLTVAPVVEIVFAGRNLQPHAPTHVNGVRDASNNLTIGWTRRTRSQVRLMGVKALPYGEDTNDYMVEILSVAEPYTVLRTIQVAAAEQTTYTAAEQATDGLTAGNLVNMRIYQKSNAAGFGLAGTWRVPANTGGAATPTPDEVLMAERRD